MSNIYMKRGNVSPSRWGHTGTVPSASTCFPHFKGHFKGLHIRGAPRLIGVSSGASSWITAIRNTLWISVLRRTLVCTFFTPKWYKKKICLFIMRLSWFKNTHRNSILRKGVFAFPLGHVQELLVCERGGTVVRPGGDRVPTWWVLTVTRILGELFRMCWMIQIVPATGSGCNVLQWSGGQNTKPKLKEISGQ